MLALRSLSHRRLLQVRCFGLQYIKAPPSGKTQSKVTPYQDEMKEKTHALDTVKTAEHLTQFNEWALNNKITFNGSEIVQIFKHMESYSMWGELFEEILVNQLQHAEFSAFQISRILEMLARLQPEKQIGQPVLDIIVEKVLKHSPKMRGDELVCTIITLVKLGVNSDVILEFCQFIPSKENFTANNIVLLMKTLAYTFVKHVNVFVTFKKKSKHLSFDASQLGAILNSMAKFQYYDEEWVNILTPQIFKHRRNFSPLGLAFLMNFFAKVGVFHEQIIVMCFEEICNKTNQLTQESIAMILHALAKFDLKEGEAYFGSHKRTVDAEEHDHLMQKLCEEIVKQIDTFNPQNITVSLFAFSCLNHYHAQTVDLLRARLKTLGMRDVPSSGLNQLYQASLWLSSEYNFNLLSAKETKWLEEVVVKKRTYLRNAETSLLHANVCTVLSDLNVPHHSEFPLVPGVLVDIVLANAKVILEVDGHHHFFRESTRRIGFPQFRTRFAVRLGWRIIVIPHFEWNELSDSSQQRQYLQTKLGALGLELS